ncbi:MAG: hypothetical protein M3463_13025 [Verrucomicrobiota bacterium]|nr:hypothetical protein [Verrucomicrobiota bacterium]
MQIRLLSPALLLAITAALYAQDKTTFEVGAFTFARPAGWKWIEASSPMRKAQLEVPGKEGGKPAEITFFHFGPGGAGGVDANVKRWLGQFQSKQGAEKVETKELGGTKATMVSTEGTFSSGMPGAPATALPDYALLGAIIEHGDGPVFVKMTGPAPVVNDARAKFLEFITAAASKK